MTGDKAARVLTGLAVLAVAVIAAAVSFTHIRALALTHGYSPDAGALLPFSVDGLLVVSSLVLMTEARAQRPAPKLARFGLILGIAGTLAANVGYGVHFGPVGALVNAWPAAAFITATEILVSQMRRTGTLPGRVDTALTVAATVPGVVPAAVPLDTPVDAPVAVPASEVYPVPAPRVRTVAARRSPNRASGRAPKAPERIFAAEIERGELPSVREVKRRAKWALPGQPRSVPGCRKFWRRSPTRPDPPLKWSRPVPGPFLFHLLYSMLSIPSCLFVSAGQTWFRD